MSRAVTVCGPLVVVRGTVSGRLIVPLTSAVASISPRAPDESRDKETVPFGVKPVPETITVAPGSALTVATLIDGP